MHPAPEHSFMKQILLVVGKEIDSNRIRVGDWTSQWQTALDRLLRKSINKETLGSNWTLDQIHLTFTEYST